MIFWIVFDFRFVTIFAQMLDVSFHFNTPHLLMEVLAPKTSVSNIQHESRNLKMLILHESVIAESLVRVPFVGELECPPGGTAESSPSSLGECRTRREYRYGFSLEISRLHSRSKSCTRRRGSESTRFTMSTIRTA